MRSIYGRGQGEGSSLLLPPPPSYLIPNALQTTSNIPRHFRCTHSNHTKTKRPHISIAPSIERIALPMPLPVNLNHKLQLLAIEIRNEGSNRMLPPKLQPQKPPPPQTLPHNLLRQRHPCAQSRRVILRTRRPCSPPSPHDSRTVSPVSTTPNHPTHPRCQHTRRPPPPSP